MKGKLQTVFSILIALFVIVPIGCIISKVAGIDQSVLERILFRRTPQLLLNSTLLMFVVMLGALFLGMFLAFLIEKTDLPFKKVLGPLLLTPLIIPCYIIGICYTNFFGLKGLSEKICSFIGLDFSLPNIYGFWGAAFVLIIGTYPYVYAIVRSSINNLDPTFSEVGRMMGMTKFTRFYKITLPLLMPACSAALVLVGLYVLSDFGVVRMLRYKTFVTSIYDQISGRYDFSSAALLSSILLSLTLILFLFQEIFVHKKNYVSTRNKLTNKRVYKLKIFKWPSFIFASLTIFIGFLLPVGILVYWTIKSFQVSGEMGIWSISFQETLKSGFNSLLLSSIVATIAVACSLPLAYLSVRQTNNRFANVLQWCAQSGLALPGVLIALGISIMFTNTIPRLNFSVLALILAFFVHFFAKSFQMTQAGLSQISKRIEEGAKLLGSSSFDLFMRVVRPLLMPALSTAWVLVFLSSMRELPAALLLRPAGFDPLTVRVWIAASEGFYEQAALPALFLVIISLPVVLMIGKTQVNVQ